MRKRKRFYNNKNRNQKWTEQEVGRPIDFAEKYAEGEGGGNKFVAANNSRTSVFAAKEKSRKRKLTAIIVLCCVAVILLGYLGADISMLRHEKPLENFNNQVTDSEYDAMSEINLKFTGKSVPAVSLDGSVMLSAVIDEAHKDGKTAVMFDAKRENGTIGYASVLASVKTFNAQSDYGKKPSQSIKQLSENDILPIARIYVYLDNYTPSRANDMALKKGKKLYRDGDKNTYLDPKSDVAYGYIKDIVNELHSYGITVFVLDGYTVKEKDYFNTVSKKLNADLGEDIKFLKAVNVRITGYDAESGDINGDGIRNDISKFPKLEENQIYIIKSGLKENRYSSILSKRKISTYIID